MNALSPRPVAQRLVPALQRVVYHLSVRALPSVLFERVLPKCLELAARPDAAAFERFSTLTNGAPRHRFSYTRRNRDARKLLWKTNQPEAYHLNY